MRLTQKVIKQILLQNEGLERSTHYSAKNFKEDNYYKVSGGQLLKRSTGKTSWADSRFDETSVADLDQTRRFINRFWNALNMDGIE